MNAHLQQRVDRRGAPLEHCQAVVLMFHGRNHTTDDILGLADRIGLPDVHYMAPQAADNSWYPARFMADFAENEPHLSHALACCHQKINELLEQGIPKTQIVLLGFSQGACLSAEYAVRNPARYGGIVLFTGGVIGPEGTQWGQEGSFQQTPVFLGTSDVDEWVPVSRVHETEAAFNRMGAVTTKRIYQGMDHIVNDDEIEQGRKIIQDVCQSHL